MYHFRAVAAVAFLSFFCEAINEIYRGQQVWRVDAHSRNEVKILQKLLLDPSVMVETHKFPHEREGSAHFRVERANVKKVRSFLRSSNMPYQVVIDDVKQHLDLEDYRNKRWRRRRSVETLEEFDYSDYHSLDEIEQWMDDMEQKHSSVTKFEIGTSLEGRTLHGIKVRTGGQKPVFYMDAAIHAREWIAPATLMYVCNQILTNSSYSRLLNELDYFFVPVVNLDGFAYTWSNARLWRKTRRPYNGNSSSPLCVGVDANRNWDINFAGTGASSDPCSILYHGPSAESEPVIHHLANFIRKEKANIKGLVSFHNYGQMILYPYNYNLTKAARTESDLNSTGQAMKSAIKRIHGTDYQSGRGSQVLYVFSGSTSDWAYEKAGIEFSYTLELRDVGSFRFELPKEQILPTGREVMEGIKVLADKLINKYGSKA